MEFNWIVCLEFRCLFSAIFLVIFITTHTKPPHRTVSNVNLFLSLNRFVFRSWHTGWHAFGMWLPRRRECTVIRSSTSVSFFLILFAYWDRFIMEKYPLIWAFYSTLQNIFSVARASTSFLIRKHLCFN